MMIDGSEKRNYQLAFELQASAYSYLMGSYK